MDEDQCKIERSMDSKHLDKLHETKMPYGKYAGTRLIDLPERYVVWFSQKGYPKGELGELLKEIYEIKVNGLEYLFDNIRNKD